MKNTLISILPSVLILAGFLALSACDSTSQYDRDLGQWLGRDEKTLVAAWGPPDTEDATKSHTRTLTYTKTRVLQYPDPAIPCTPVIHGNPRSGAPVVSNDCLNLPPPIQLPLTCETTFTLKEGKIVNWSHKGNICRS